MMHLQVASQGTGVVNVLMHACTRRGNLSTSFIYEHTHGSTRGLTQTSEALAEFSFMEDPSNHEQHNCIMQYSQKYSDIINQRLLTNTVTAYFTLVQGL
jgi:hypothetical protein